MKTLGLLLASAGACVLMGCEGTHGGCVPGQSVTCACPSGRSGAQVCRMDQTYDACVCSGGAPQSCVPGQSIACVCTDGRSGAQTCRGDRTYDACVCTGGPAIDLREEIEIDLAHEIDLRR